MRFQLLRQGSDIGRDRLNLFSLTSGCLIFNRGNEDKAEHGAYPPRCGDPDARLPAWSDEFRVGFNEAPFSFRMNKPTALSTGEWITDVEVARRIAGPAIRLGKHDRRIARSPIVDAHAHRQRQVIQKLDKPLANPAGLTVLTSPQWLMTYNRARTRSGRLSIRPCP